MRDVFRQLWMILRLSGIGWNYRWGISLYILVLGLELAQIPVSVRMIQWSADFYGALEEFNGDEALIQVGVLGLIVGAWAGLSLASDYLRKWLVIKWRQDLTETVINRWLDRKVFWRLQNGFGAKKIDNPDQRIADDCRMFTEDFVRETISLITSVTGVFSYVAVLWSLSNFPLSFSVFSLDVEIPRYMVWAAFLYVLISSGLTHLLGYPLKSLNFQQQLREANYRIQLVRVRENADAIALSGAEEGEKKLLDSGFSDIVGNWKRLIFQEFLLGCFRTPYQFTILRIPLLLALPAYFGGFVTFGGLMQLSSAFQRVVTTLSWFIFAYSRLAKLAATITRLGDLLDRIEAVHDPQGGACVTQHDGQNILISGLQVLSPDQRQLNIPEDLVLTKGEHVWISGPSGLGKSSFLKSIGGIWPFGQGSIKIPETDQVAFLSQFLNFPDGPISLGAIYPFVDLNITADQLANYLEVVGLQFFASQVRAGEDPSLQGMSGGERQRLAFVRLLVSRPDWIFLDEATSAIDQEMERKLLRQFQQSLPNTTLIIVAHRKPVGIETLRHIDLLDPIHAVA